jgi:hypothetical protein
MSYQLYVWRGIQARWTGGDLQREEITTASAHQGISAALDHI